MKKTKVEYFGKDLEAMDHAENYHQWIFSLIKPYLGKNLVEVGAGTGTFSKLLLGVNPVSLFLIEPSDMYEKLAGNISEISGETAFACFQDLFRNVADVIKKEKEPDSIIYINVLEHIQDDENELEIVHRTLAKDGRLCIFVPAQQFLYSDFDRSIGHFRRYKKNELADKCRAAGFKILMARNFDLPGILPWFIKYRLLKSTTMEQSLTSVYDKYAVPVAKWLESRIHPPIGKNLLVVAAKSQ
ncbi:MAG TPA: methyltransferase domain-containing protein [Pyrinomonadaceae bacterium]|nr:methyltransferase domain-containing protein [Pyrinomonadaceae bacterium]